MPRESCTGHGFAHGDSNFSFLFSHWYYTLIVFLFSCGTCFFQIQQLHWDLQNCTQERCHLTVSSFLVIPELIWMQRTRHCSERNLPSPTSITLYICGKSAYVVIWVMLSQEKCRKVGLIQFWEFGHAFSDPSTLANLGMNLVYLLTMIPKWDCEDGSKTSKRK